MAGKLLTIEDYRYDYPDGTAALKGVDLAIERGEKVGLVGPNGSGKSTLMMCTAGLFRGQGLLQVGDKAVTSTDGREVRGRVGLVFQNPDDQLFMPTLADDLAFGPINLGWPSERVRESVQRTAEHLELAELLERPPHHLSMGQKRNAAIATVLAMQPELILLDEPSSNLDPRSRRHLLEVLADLPATLLIAAHDMELIGRLCGRVLLIDDGRIMADGPTGRILGDRELMEKHGLEVWPPRGG